MQEFIEKLIGRLEEELKETREMQTIQCKGNDGYGTPLQSKLSGEIGALLKVKNIVNQLAEEYDNDFCEWKQEESGIFPIKTKCGNSIDVNYGYEFCPYCGKKIKIAHYQPKGE